MWVTTDRHGRGPHPFRAWVGARLATEPAGERARHRPHEWVAQEAARAAATASNSGDAAAHGVARGTQVADGYRLQEAIVTVDARDFRPGGEVRADATVTVSLATIPIFGTTAIRLHHQHAEPVDPFRNLR